MAVGTMKTVDKALGLLQVFGTATPELGLTEIARRVEVDKATALRLLNALAAHGFVEQDPGSRRYRLGSAVLRFARVRETCFPAATLMQPVLERLAAETGETAHGSLASGPALSTVAVAEPPRPARVWIDPGQPLPYHATASGLAYLAFAPADALAAVLDAADLPAFTDRTAARDDLASALARVRGDGHAVAARTFEPEVVGVAAPVLGPAGTAVGAVAVACVAGRWTDAIEADVAPRVRAAAAEVGRALGWNPPRPGG